MIDNISRLNAGLGNMDPLSTDNRTTAEALFKAGEELLASSDSVQQSVIEQNHELEGISSSMNTISIAIQSTASGSEQLLASSENLQVMAEELKAFTEKYHDEK